MRQAISYHTLNLSERTNRILRKLDHSMIFVLIAGSYTNLPDRFERSGRIFPVRSCLGNRTDRHYRKIYWITLSEMVSSVLYISMGWVCVLAFHTDCQFALSGSFWMAPGGGIIYTVGGIIYALKVPLFDAKHKKFRLT